MNVKGALRGAGAFLHHLPGSSAPSVPEPPPNHLDEAVDELRASLREHLSDGCCARVQNAYDAISALAELPLAVASTAENRRLLRESLGCLYAAERILAAEQRDAPWLSERRRTEEVFELECLWGVGKEIQDAAPSDALRADMERKLTALRQAINDVMAGAPLL